MLRGDQRYPLEIYGGTYGSPGALTRLADDAKKTHMESIKKDLPDDERDLVNDSEETAISAGNSLANPLRLYVDKPLPNVLWSKNKASTS